MDTSSRSDIFRAVPAVALILAASATNFLRHHDYPLLSPEVGLFAIFLGLLALAISALFGIRNRYWRAYLEAAIVFLAMDLNADSPLATILAASAALVYLILTHRTLLPILTVMFGVAFLTSLAGLGGTKALVEQKQTPSPTITTTRPAVLHLILDEHIGLEGLPLTSPEAAHAKDEIKEIYMSQGFRVYGGAYSEHANTINAIPHILNFGNKWKARADKDKGVILGENAYFEAMKRYGYKIHIVQSDFAEYCSSSAYASCTTYWAEGLGFLRDVRFSTLERGYLMVFKFLSLSHAIDSLTRLHDAAAMTILGRESPPIAIDERRRSSTIGAIAAFDALNSQLIQARPGELYFMHALAPHYPYVVRKDCSLLPPMEWGFTTTSEQYRKNGYLAQLYCITRKVEAAVRALSQSPAKDNFVVIVHGDHGSRITRRFPDEENLGKFDGADMVAGFSTLLALKGPGVQPGYDSHPAPVALLLGQWVEGEFRTAPRPKVNGAAQVYLTDSDMRPTQLYPLPQSWLDSLTEVGTQSSLLAPTQGPHGGR